MVICLTLGLGEPDGTWWVGSDNRAHHICSDIPLEEVLH